MKYLDHEEFRRIAAKKFQTRNAVSPNVKNSSGFNFSVRRRSLVGEAAQMISDVQKIGWKLENLGFKGLLFSITSFHIVRVSALFATWTAAGTIHNAKRSNWRRNRSIVL